MNLFLSQITIDWKSANFYTPRIRNGEIRMMKYVYVAITIMKDDVLVLWKGREGFFALTRKLIQFSDKKQPSDKFTHFMKIPPPPSLIPYILFSNGTLGMKCTLQDVYSSEMSSLLLDFGKNEQVKNGVIFYSLASARISTLQYSMTTELQYFCLNQSLCAYLQTC